MTASELLFAIGLLVFGCLVMAWILIDARRKQSRADAGGSGDRDEVLAMLRGVKDQASMSVYKRVYDIKDDELWGQKRV